MRGRNVMVALLVAVLGINLWMAAGCGSSQKGNEGTQEAEESQPQPSPQPQPQPSPTPTPSPDPSTSGGNTEFSLGSQSIGGNYVPDPRIVDIRWSDHTEYYRIVFEFENADGSGVTSVPKTSTWYPKPNYGIAIYFDNFATWKYDYDEFTEGGAPVSLGDALVQTMYRWDTADGEPVTFEVDCAFSEAHPGVSSRPHRIMYQTNPMRIILDIQKQ